MTCKLSVLVVALLGGALARGAPPDVVTVRGARGVRQLAVGAPLGSPGAHGAGFVGQERARTARNTCIPMRTILPG